MAADNIKFSAGIALISGCEFHFESCPFKQEYDTEIMEPSIYFFICIIGEEHLGKCVNSL